MSSATAPGGDEATLIWPSHYPDQCPPADSVPAQGTYLRYVDTLPPESAEDTQSHLQLKISGHPRYRGRTYGDTCMAAGFSVFDTAVAAEKVLRFAKALRKKRLAQVDVTGSGVMMQTGSNLGHFTWWRPAGDDSWENSEWPT